MAPQTSYTMTHKPGFPGMTTSQIKRSDTGRVHTGSSPIPAGRIVAFASGDNGVKLPDALADRLLGGVILENISEPKEAGSIVGNMLAYVREGDLYVECEEAMAKNDPVYVRVLGTADQRGKVRKTPGGVAAVFTITPTPANNTVFSLTVTVNGQTFTFNVVSDADGTATEIATAFRNAMAANAAFTALVTASGTATLILTGATAGQTISVISNGPGVLGVVNTTPAAAVAVLMPNVRVKWGTFSDDPDLVCLSFNIP